MIPPLPPFFDGGFRNSAEIKFVPRRHPFPETRVATPGLMLASTNIPIYGTMIVKESAALPWWNANASAIPSTETRGHGNVLVCQAFYV